MIGHGALGAYTAARLAAAGHRITIACRTAESAEHLRGHGVTAIEADGTRIHAAVAAVDKAKDVQADVDAVLLTTKCGAARKAWKQWRTAVPDGVPVVALQNGLMGPTLSDDVGDGLVLCTVAFPATRTGTGESQRTGPGGYLLGAWPPRKRPDRYETAAQALLADAGDAEIVEDIEGVQWTKLLINSCISSLGAVTGAQLAELLKDARARDVFLDVFTEGRQVGKAAGVRFASIHGLHPDRVADKRPGQGRRLRHLVLRAAAARFGRHRSSSLQSLERGEKTEVDFLNGTIVDHGRRHGVATPVNAAIVARIHAIEAGNAVPDLAHLDALRAAADEA